MTFEVRIVYDGDAFRWLGGEVCFGDRHISGNGVNAAMIYTLLIDRKWPVYDTDTAPSSRRACRFGNWFIYSVHVVCGIGFLVVIYDQIRVHYMVFLLKKREFP